jgi:hypothetical protein
VKKNIKIILLCFAIPISVSSEWLEDARRVGLFAKMETGIESMHSDRCNFNGSVTCGKWFNDFFDIYMGVQQSLCRSYNNSFTGILFGTDVTLFDSDRFAINVNIESQSGSEKAMYFSPGLELFYKLRSSVSSGLHLTIDEVLNKRDSSWTEDDTETVIIESKAKKFYSLQTELKIGYSRQIIQNQFFQFTVNPLFRHKPIQGEKIVDLGCITLGHKYYLNSHFQMVTELNIEIPQVSETTTFGIKLSLSTY